MRGDCDNSNGNFIQLIGSQEFASVDNDKWLTGKVNKYTSPEVQNECLQLMALHISVMSVPK